MGRGGRGVKKGGGLYLKAIIFMTTPPPPPPVNTIYFAHKRDNNKTGIKNVVINNPRVPKKEAICYTRAKKKLSNKSQ